MSHGLVSVVPKDERGNPVTNMQNQLIDIDKNAQGTQEAKEWIAIIEFMKSFPKNENGLHVIPDTYKKGDETMIVLPK